MAYNVPGVYVEEISTLPPSVAAVETAIPAFIGYTAFAKETTDGDLILVPIRITSMVDYTTYFGSADPETKIAVTIAAGSDGVVRGGATLADGDRSVHLMYYALQLFFANGGGPCYIVSVGTYKALDVNDLENGLTEIGKEDEPTLLIFPEAQNLSIGDYATLHTAALAQCAALQNRFVIMDLHGDTVSLATPNVPAGKTILDAAKNFRNANIGTADDVKYGAVYAPNLETTIDFVYTESATEVTVGGTTKTMDKYLTDTPPDGASYQLAKAAIKDLSCKLPPAGAIAGICAAVDNSRGVWKAPANVNIATVIQPTIQITNSDQDTLNVDTVAGKSINAIRAFTGLGTLVWGARTLAGNDNEWRYVNVRRFCIFAEESIRRATRQFVFEPNDANTWVKVQGMIENFLTTQWRQGALMGTKAADAFSVSVGLGSTMSALDVLEGRMIVVVALCPVRPAEFIVLRFVQTMPVS
ncbi:MAG: phage tail sheath subtilisin-like domain-containing protein [Rhizomicrobium sp.]|nr:phage tail sheath subtilisin-like domain-containing protein [Rhizomicrobium sp.]